MTSTAATKILTEDDTFDILRRTPIQALDFEYRTRLWEFYADDEIFDEWLTKHGWNKEDFHAAGNAYEQSKRIHRG